MPLLFRYYLGIIHNTRSSTVHPDFYNVGDRFLYSGTEYKIKTVTENALEVASNSEQSLWVSLDQLKEKLSLQGKNAYFQWQNKYLIDN